MIDRLILGAVLSVAGLNGLLPTAVEPVKPLTPAQLQAKAKHKSISNVCKSKRKSKTVKELCQQWEKQNA